MIKKLFIKLKNRFFSESHPMEYRISMIFFFVAFFVSILSATTNTLLNKGIFGIIFQWVFIAMMGVFFFLSPKRQLILFRPLVLLVGIVYIPFLFTQTAGYDGTALMFSLLALFIISIAFEGKLRISLIIINVAILIGLCFLEFFVPELIIPHEGEQAKFVDQLVALIVSTTGMAILSIYIIDALKKGILYTNQVLTELKLKNRTLAEISQIFINLHHDEGSMRQSMELAASFLGCDYLIFWLKDEEGLQLNAKYKWSKTAEEKANIVAERFLEGYPLYDAFVMRNERFLMENKDNLVSLSVPIFIENEIWGALEISYKLPFELTDSDTQLAILLTSVYASFLERRKYEVSIEKQLNQQSLIATIFNSFINIDNLDNRIYESLALLGSFLECLEVDIFECNIQTPKYKWKGDAIETSAFKYIDYTAAFVNQKAPYIVDDSSSKYASLIVPYYINNVFSGTIFFNYQNKDRTWQDNEIQLVLMYVATYSVVIDRHIQSESLIEAKTQAEAASRAKSNFLSNMSHEIRTPMNAIIGLTQVGLRSKNSQKQLECLSKIDISSKQLLGIVNDILDIAKIESGKVELEYSTLDIKEMINNTKEMMKVSLKEKNLKLDISFSHSIELAYHGDAIRINQIITNLLSNAIKFTPDGGKIDIYAEQVAISNNSARLRISVADTGIGITKEQMARIFNSFEQADNNVNRRFGGTGLGLAIVKNLVEKMNGRIWVESALGVGSRFIFEIELQVLNSDKSQNKPVEQTKVIDYSKLHVLLAEDIEINRLIFEELLANSKIKIDTALDGNEAVEMFKNNLNKYDIIFMDVQMPVVDGLEATRIIRSFKEERAKTIPIIALTANVFKEDIDRCLAAGMNDHLGKPIMIDKVFEILSKYIKTQ